MGMMVDEIKALVADGPNELGPGRPDPASRSRLEALAGVMRNNVRNRDVALACLAGLWLLHDFLEESHAISQDLDTLEGSYWHGIMHRREPDYWNAKYWFRRVPSHPIFAELCREAAALAREAGMPPGSEYLVRQSSWDAAAFVDLCEKASAGPESLTLLCRRIQRREWDLLFAYCRDRAFAPDQ